MSSDVSANTGQYSCTIAGQKFTVLDFGCREEVSALFRIHLTLWSEDADVDITGLLRQTATIKISWGGKTKQYFGLVTSFSQVDAGRPGLGGVDKVFGEYVCEVLPTFWLLGQHRHCRIFQDMPADKIIRKVLDERGMAGKYDFRASGTPTREYCVQYRETDMAFVLRLMEEEGLFYYFTHQGKEMMVIGDAASHYDTCAPESTVKYKTASGVLATTEEHLTSLTWDANAFTGKVKYKDFDYLAPKKPLKVEQTGPKNDDLEIYDYHRERYKDDGRGRSLAKVVVDAEASMRENLSGSGSWRSASAGCKFTLEKAWRGDLNKQWVVVQASHSAQQLASTGVQYSTSFLAVPADTVLRPLARTPRPIVNPQTAFVTGPPGEVIYMDKYGRAKVQFHWDPDGKKDDKSSCWIRVAQPFAGIDPDTQKKHGFQWHPLVGDEVVVVFLEGDPDRPIIVGSAYNADNMPPIKPDELIRAMILTRYQHRLLMDDKNTAITMNTGGDQELKMVDKNEDSDGKVTLRTHGDQYLLLEDKLDPVENIVLLRTTQDHQHMLQMTTAEGADGAFIQTKSGHFVTLSDTDKGISITTAGKHKIKLEDSGARIIAHTSGGHAFEMDDGKKKILLKSTAGHKIEIDDIAGTIEVADSAGSESIKIESMGGNISLTASNNITITAGGSFTISAGSSLSLTAGSNASIEAGSDLQTTAGSNATTTVGGSATVTVGSDLTETVGSSATTTVGSNATTTVGSSLTVTAGASATITSGASTSITSGAVTTITGALVKIN